MRAGRRREWRVERRSELQPDRRQPAPVRAGWRIVRRSWRGDVWTCRRDGADQMLQPFGTLDGENADAAGVRVFFVEEPNNGVEAVVSKMTSARSPRASRRSIYEYSGAQLGGDGILAPSETSGAKTWKFPDRILATEFQFQRARLHGGAGPGRLHRAPDAHSASVTGTPVAMVRTVTSTAGATTSSANSATARTPTATPPWRCRRRRV